MIVILGFNTICPPYVACYTQDILCSALLYFHNLIGSEEVLDVKYGCIYLCIFIILCIQSSHRRKFVKH